ncbi:LemA protein [Bhargavaea ginsengi]|jgi:LemA protein|uniref:LemA protein n=1 Tax=Bhargavaea ginsengi TaxID=426757 RepID=A0A1H7CA20_9BACL|nr:LemA family protein [Bhargavaea ginsengi]MCM3087753.1 LemA family protein [Bhargavaea ginsengi]SEJ82495.1 LemA protein [Bhargavaea ginsengi]
MRKMMGPILIIVGILVVLAIMLVPKYNGFVNLEEDVNQAYSQIENQLQRRMDLIPNLVETAKGYAAHEEEVFTDIADARSRLAGAGSPEEQANANEELTGALSRLLVIAENYPDLKANENFRQLMDELAGTENRLAVARMDYNEAATEYNRNVRRFPGNLVAGIFGFDQKEYFEASEAAQEAPKVDFGEYGN